MPKNAGELRRHLAVGDDWETESGFRSILQKVAGPFYTGFVEAKSCRRVVECREIDRENKDRNRVQFYFVLKPGAIDGFTIMGANLKESALFEWLTMHGTRLSPHRELSADLPTTHRPRNGNIYYAFDRDFNSRHFLKMNPEGLEQYERAASEMAGSTRYLLHTNAKPKGCLVEAPNCVLSPIKPHGLNRQEYMACTTMISVGAFNRRPKHIGFMKWLGFSDRAIRQDPLDMAYQFCFRSNLRVPDATEEITIIVPDRGTAEFLGDKQPGLKVNRLPGFEKFDKKEATRAPCVSQKHRNNRKVTIVDELRGLQ